MASSAVMTTIFRLLSLDWKLVRSGCASSVLLKSSCRLKDKARRHGRAYLNYYCRASSLDGGMSAEFSHKIVHMHSFLHVQEQ